MAENSPIEWTDDTWNPVTGCSVVSPGCTNCYAMKLAGTRLRHQPSRKDLTVPSKAGPVWNGQVRFNEQWLDQPMRRKRPRMIFVCAHGDLFHENVPDEWIDRVFAVMALSPQHTFQVLTKRSARMREWFAERWQPAPARKLPDGFPIPAETRGETRRTQVERACEPLLEAHGLVDTDNDELWTEDGRCKAMQWDWPLPNVWLGVSAEDQARADQRIPDLLATPAAVRFLSAEPLLGPIDLTAIAVRNGVRLDALQRYVARSLGDGHWDHRATTAPGFDWVIAGGESGHGVRPMHPDWARSLRDQCARAGVPFFFKQWGNFRPLTDAERGQACGATLIDGADPHDREAYVMRTSKKRAGRLLDGVEHNGMPQPREVPAL